MPTRFLRTLYMLICPQGKGRDKDTQQTEQVCVQESAMMLITLVLGQGTKMRQGEPEANASPPLFVWRLLKRDKH